MYWCILIDWMSQSAVALYIYRVGWTYPVRNPYYRSRSIKILIWLGLLDRSDQSDLPVRPVGPCRTGHSASIGQTGWCQFWLSIYAPCFLVKLACQKTSFWAKIVEGRWLTLHRPFFVLRAINNYRPCLSQVDVEATCFGRHTFFMIADVIGTASTFCSIAFFLCIRCSLRFWVWDKPEGHHLGCKYFESCSLLFSFFLLQ